MLRGVNKNIIEVLETENQYFEKAILFIRPAHVEKESNYLSMKAKEYVKSVAVKQPDKPKQRELDLDMWFKLGGASALGAAATALCMWMM